MTAPTRPNQNVQVTRQLGIRIRAGEHGGLIRRIDQRELLSQLDSPAGSSEIVPVIVHPLQTSCESS